MGIVRSTAALNWSVAIIGLFWEAIIAEPSKSREQCKALEADEEKVDGS